MQGIRVIVVCDCHRSRDAPSTRRSSRSSGGGGDCSFSPLHTAEMGNGTLRPEF